jgi:hypothetical protein
MSDTTAIRNPDSAGSNLDSRTGTRSRSGGPSAFAIPTPTRLADAAPATTPTVRDRNTRRFTGGVGGAGGSSSATTGAVAVASSGALRTQPRSASLGSSSTASTRNR